MSTEGARLAQYVLNRRRELELSQVDVWQAGGPSNTTLTEIENGRMESLNRTTAKRLDVGLRWEPGSARRVWNGSGDPVPLLPGVDPDDSATLRRAIEAARIDEDKRDQLLRVLDSA